MKRKTPRILRSALAVFLTVSMVLGMCGAAFAAGDTTIEYVSLGDSMTNGYGLDGYDKNGFLMEVPQSYPVLFQKWLATETGKTVDLSQLGVSALRAEDFWYILDYGTEGAFPGDEYSLAEVVSRCDDAGTDYDTIEEVAAFYQGKVANADVISLHIGSNNFSTFMTQRIGWCVTQMAPSFAMFHGTYFNTDIANLLVGMTAEEAAKITGLYEDMKELAMQKLTETGEFDPTAKIGQNSAGVPYTAGQLVEDMADAAAYTIVGFVVAYRNVMDRILELNPDAQIIIVPITNWLTDVNVKIDEFTTIPVGDMLEVLYSMANVYTASMAVIYNEKGADIGYADVDDVELLAEQMANNADQPAAVAIPTKITRSRMVRDIYKYVFEMVGSSYFAKIDLDDVEVYEANYPSHDYGAINDHFGRRYGITDPADMDKYYTSCVAYLGIEQAFIKTADLGAFEVGTFLTLATDGALMEVVSEAMSSVFALKAAGEEIFPSHVAAAMMATPELQGLVNIFATYVAGDGVLCHPSINGHVSIFEAMKYGYQNKVTSVSEYLEEKLTALANTVTDMAMKELAKLEGMTEEILQKIEDSGIRKTVEEIIDAVVNFDAEAAEKAINDYVDTIVEAAMTELEKALADAESALNNALAAAGQAYTNATSRDLDEETIDEDFDYVAMAAPNAAGDAVKAAADEIAKELKELGNGFDGTYEVAASADDAAVKNADLITLFVGPNEVSANIAAILSGAKKADWTKYDVVNDAVNNATSEIAALQAKLEAVLSTEEAAKIIAGVKDAAAYLYANCEAVKSMADSLPDMLPVLTEEQIAQLNAAANVANAYAYTAVEFAVGYIPTLAAINKANPNALVAVVDMYTPCEEVLEVAGVTIPVAAIMEYIADGAGLMFLPYAMFSGTNTVYIPTAGQNGNAVQDDIFAALGLVEQNPTVPGGPGDNDDPVEPDPKPEPEVKNPVMFPKLFTVKMVVGEGGKVNVSDQFAIAFGASRTIKITPDEGYEVANILVNGKSVGAAEKYTLKAASKHYVIEVVFAEIVVETEEAEATETTEEAAAE